MASAVI